MSRKKTATVAYERPRRRKKKNAAASEDYVAVDPQGRFVAGPFKDYHVAKAEADKARGFVKLASEAAECGCPHLGAYGKDVEDHLRKMGSPDPAHDLKHSDQYVQRCQAGGIDAGVCAAVIYGAVHHHHPPSSHMTEETGTPRVGQIWINPHSKATYEVVADRGDGWIEVKDLQTGEISSVSIRTHIQQYGWKRVAEERPAALRWAEVWFEHERDGDLFVSRIEKVNSTIVADRVGHIVTTNATEHDVDRVLAMGGYKERFAKTSSVGKAAEEAPRRWWLVVYTNLRGERGETQVRARDPNEALAKAMTDAKDGIDINHQVRTIPMKLGAAPDISAGLEANDSAPTCQPFTRVERDPARFNACMLRAKSIGPVKTSRQVYDLVHADLEKFDEEHFLVLCLDFRGAVRDYVEINIGQRHKVNTEVEDIVAAAILSKCDGLICIHNHPSGVAEPSEADGRLTESVRKAMSIACPTISLVDHVVVGNNQYYSFAEKKLHKVK